MEKNLTGTVYDAWLASACIPADTFRLLLSYYGDSAACFRAFEQGDQFLSQHISDRFLDLLEKKGTAEQLERMQDLILKHSINVLRFDDPDYPDSLTEINQPPPVFFYQGNLQCLKKRILAMVGSRAASYDGQKAARKLACELSRHGVSIVSGLACGIDGASHTGCIEGGTPTIAVTACGLDTVYPRDHIGLRNEILSHQGLILSEYAPGEKPAGWHFPVRNRIIAGLGQALVLIEAKTRSGSMTSVQHALDQGKDVFVYPGDPASVKYEGNHQLLREGGIYFTSAEDILGDLRWLDNQSSVRQNSDCAIHKAVVSPEQQSVVSALAPGKLSFEQLLLQTHLDPSILMGTLTIMQISGIIEALPGKQYQLK